MNFDLLEELYKTICHKHIKLLYDLYNFDLKTGNKTPNSRKIILRFIDDDKVNAFAKVNKVDEVSIHKGLLKKTHECIQKMVDCNETYSDYEDKQVISVFMFSVILHYIIAHEFAHLYNGHCDMLNYVNSKNISLQFAYDSNIGISPLDFQTLEMNADALAMCRTINYVMFESYHNKKILELVHNKNQTINVLIHAINIMFFVLRGCLPPIHNPNYDKYTHHPNFLRQVMNYQTIKKYLKIEYNKKISDDLLDEFFALDEKKLSELYFVPVILDHYIMNLDREIICYEKKLRNNWRKISEHIAPYSRTEPAIIEDITLQ